MGLGPRSGGGGGTQSTVLVAWQRMHWLHRAEQRGVQSLTASTDLGYVELSQVLSPQL